MFDVGFSEMVVIAIVALIVIGPERLPAVARTVGTLLGRLRRYTEDVKAEVNRELQLEEIRKMQKELADQAQTLQQNVDQGIAGTADSVVDALKIKPEEENRIHLSPKP
jgi:sec-independent protein translocase protein TatB